MMNLQTKKTDISENIQEEVFNQKKLLKLSNRSLFYHLYEKGVLSEKDVKKLQKYTKLHRESKADIGAPRVTQSQIGSLASKFTAHAPLVENTFCPKYEQQLITFRKIQRVLHRDHQDLITFAERLFDEPKNLLDFYNSWTLSQRNQGALALKNLATLLKL